MAVTLNQIDQISDGQVIKAGHISQSLVAFSGRAAYNINLSGSFAVTGSMYHSEVSDAAGVASSVLVRDNTTGEYYTTGSYGVVIQAQVIQAHQVMSLQVDLLLKLISMVLFGIQQVVFNIHLQMLMLEIT